MATAATIIARSLRLLGQTEAGENPTDDEYADALVTLNAMIDGWRNERTMCYATRDESLTLSAATSSYTVGPSGTLVTTRPVAIEAAWIVASGTSYPVGIATDAEYGAISSKLSTSDWPTVLNYRPAMPNGTVYVWPVPNATRTLMLQTRTPFTAFATTADTVSLPPGWEDALAFNLAANLAPEFQMEASATVIQRSRDTLASIKRLNSAPIMAVTQLVGLLGGGGKSNILTDGQ